MEIRSLSKALSTIDRMKSASARAREKTGEVMEQALNIVETGGTSFLFGLLEGRIDKPAEFELAGVPYPLLAGLAGHGLAFLGIGRGMESHLHAVANGALSAHLNGLGRKMGADMRAKAAAPAVQGDLSAALPPRRVGSGITERDLVELVNAD